MATESLAERMKAYEVPYNYVITKRLPVIVRIDGIGFSSYTSGCAKPFDASFSDVMLDVTKVLVNHVQGCVLGYTQSDEASFLLHGYKRFSSQPWRSNKVQKIVSEFASVAGAHFTQMSHRIWKPGSLDGIRPATFDARVFVLPEAEVNNYFLSRQQSGIGNSIQMLTRSLYSHKEVENNNCDSMQEMCEAKGIQWEDTDLRFQRGATIRRVPELMNTVVRDVKIPLFNENPAYVESLLVLEKG